MSTMRNVESSRIALFIDVENLIGSASTIGLPIDVGPILERLKQYGRVEVRRSFGDLDKCLSSINRAKETGQIRRMLHLNLVQIEDIPFITASKNTADVRLVVEALSLAYQNPDVTHFAIVASDRDYVPLYNKLRELGKTIFAIGIDQSNMNPMVREASDLLFYYEALFRSPGLDGSREENENRKNLLDSYYSLLTQSVRNINNHGGRVLATNLPHIMRQIRSDFSPELIGCKSFKEFLDLAAKENIVKIHVSPGTDEILVSIDSDALPIAERPYSLPQPKISKDYKKISEYYRSRLEDKIRITFPSYRARKQIIKVLEESYDNLINEGPIEINDWSQHAI